MATVSEPIRTRHVGCLVTGEELHHIRDLRRHANASHAGVLRCKGLELKLIFIKPSHTAVSLHSPVRRGRFVEGRCWS